jgi:hypothetical protein
MLKKIGFMNFLPLPNEQILVLSQDRFAINFSIKDFFKFALEH